MQKQKMLEIREMQAQDAAAAAQIEAENFSKPWKEADFLGAVKDEKALYLVAYMDKIPVGYIGMWTVLDEGEITNVSVKKEYQGQKIGRALLEKLEISGREKGISTYFLEVRESNQNARRLYESCGFSVLSIRKNFYEEPVENGIVMCKR